MILFAIVGLSITFSNVMMLSGRGRVRHNSLASQIAIETLEEFAGLDPSTLGDSNDSSSDLSRDGVDFHRSVNVTASADGSRTIAVVVTCPLCRYGGTASLANNFPLWGSN